MSNEKWYNHERKQWYIDWCKENKYEESTLVLLERIFASTALVEKAFKKDVAEFNNNEVVDLFKSYNSKSPLRLKTWAYYLRNYYQWCYDKNIVTNIINPYDERTIDIIIKNIIPEEVYKDKFFGKEQLKYWVENKILDDINKFIAVGYFYGLSNDELINLKITDFNNEDKTVKLITGRIIKVDDFFIKYMKLAANATEYNAGYPMSNIKNMQFVTYNSGEYVIRQTGGDVQTLPVKYTLLSNRMMIIREQTENPLLSRSSLYKNGLINFIKEKYQEKGITLKTALFHQVNKKIYTYDKDTEEYIKEFGSGMTARMLRMQIKDVIDYYD